MKRILLADDHQLMRQGLKAILASEPDLEVVAEASDGEEVVALAREVSPDIVVMDISMPGQNGDMATARILAADPEIKVIGLSMHGERHYIKRMLAAGAMGYLLKDCAAEELVMAISTITEGRKYLSPAITDVVVDGYLGQALPTMDSTISPREEQVLQGIAEGKNTKQIALDLAISAKTIETHRRQLMLKLDLHSVADLTRYAIRVGLVSLSS